MQAIEIEKLLDSPDSTVFQGTSGCYLPLDDDWGVKFFYCESSRDYSYDQQRYYETMRVAPLTGPKVKFTYQGEVHYGYITEHCQCCDTAVMEYHHTEIEDGRCEGCDYFDLTAGDEYDSFLMDNPEWGDKYFELKGRLESHNIRFNDDHAGNWGINHMGEPVIIDFDKSSSSRV